MSGNSGRISDRSRGFIAGTVFALLIGVNMLASKIALEYTDPYTVFAWRFNFAMMAVAVVLIAIKKNPLSALKLNKDVILTAFSYILFMLLQVVGLVYSTSIEGAILFSIVPILSKVLSGFVLKEKSTKVQNVLMVCSVSAVIFSVISEVSGVYRVNPFGITLLFASSVVIAISNVWMRKVREVLTPFDISCTIIIYGVIFANLVCFIGTKFEGYFTVLNNENFVFSVAYLGIGAILCSSLLMAYSLAKLSTVEGTIFGNLSTVIAIILGATILLEPFGFAHLVAVVVVIVSVIGIGISGNKMELKNEGANEDR